MPSRQSKSHPGHLPDPEPKFRLLVAEDDRHLADAIARRLQEEGYLVDLVHDGKEAFDLALSKNYHLIILDLLLPEKDGLQVIRGLRKNRVDSMILVLTIKSTVEDRVEGFRSGADDYMLKPFAFAELIARVGALLRRCGAATGRILRVADLEIDPDTRVVRRARKEIHLTQKEYLLLELLVRNKNRTMTRREIAEQVWGYSFDTGTNIVDVYVNYLRKAIDEGFSGRLLHTVRGVGFVIREM
ncbi:MAG TPA: response regulator transcription factor [Bacteroidota bacterium]|nr:response regulator transcription factor [Bacteroidota bacterium]